MGRAVTARWNAGDLRALNEVLAPAKIVHKTDGRRDPVDGHFTTACGLRSITGGVGELDSRNMSKAWRFVTCAKCKRVQVRGVTPAMVRMLERAAVDPIYGKPKTRLLLTRNALTARGLLFGGEVTEAGRAYLAARKKGKP